MLPVPITGDFARDYHYFFSLYYNPVLGIARMLKDPSSLNILTQFLKIASNVTLPYVSQLAHRVSPAPDKISTDNLDICGVKVPVPVSYDLSPFTVTYFDDTVNTVYNFHVGWQNSVRNGWNFNLLYLCALSCVYGPGIKPPDSYGFVIPTSVTNHPFVFPVEIKQSDLAAEGDNLREVTVTYIRLPNIKKESAFISGIKKRIASVLK